MKTTIAQIIFETNKEEDKFQSEQLLHMQMLRDEEDGGFNNVLVIGANSLSRYVDWTDRGTCILFGDGAGVVLVQKCLRLLVISSLAKFGNTSAASIPLALDEAVRSRKLKQGQTIATVGFGAGISIFT
ncbi:hypothetical protein L2E82_45908 [Cichorium intybus]|uniref:Uncharacterized protein n=1 Tax=Cichorium intybus TaxID=13427 RepID=A0ACB8ZTB0_CICIN|nr:hypothetical protein L2E82_45908 [Cichorium intybus]